MDKKLIAISVRFPMQGHIGEILFCVESHILMKAKSLKTIPFSYLKQFLEFYNETDLIVLCRCALL